MTAPGTRLPYPGLRAFTREESDLFFGRESCVDAMVDRLAATRFLAVLGPSGSGKSSLVRTGLLDALDLGLHPWAGSRWLVADLHPGGQPLRNLAAALLTAKGSSSEAMDVELLSAFLGHGPRSVAEWVSAGNLPPETNLLLLVDQFEELFRYGDYAQREEAEAFVGLLLESAEAAGLAIHVVITMRSEYLGACTLIPGLAERINAGLYLTPRMSRENCREAIEGPAGVTGFKVAPALVNRLLNDLARFAPWEADQNATQLELLSRRSDQLPLMQHVLNRLWIRAASHAGRGGVELSLSDYEQTGGLSGALDAHGAEVIAALGAGRARYVEPVFRALVSGTSLALAVRRPCRLGELVEVAEGARSDVVAVVQAFRASDCNFLRTSEESLTGDDVIVDISHESLIRQWTPLRAWLEEEAHDGMTWRRLVSAQERHTQGEGGLLTGLDLHSLLAWWETASPKPAWAARHGGDFEAVQAYLETSRKTEAAQADALRQREARERNRLRLGVAALATALVLVTGLSLYARSKEQSARASAEREQESAKKAKASAELAVKNANLAFMNEERANRSAREAKANEALAQKSALEAKANEERALENAKLAAATVEDVSNVLYADHYSGLVGVAPLQSELMKKLLPYQSKVQDVYSSVIDPASVVTNKYRLAITLEKIGDASQAIEVYAEAYERGLKAVEAVPAGKRPPESLEVSFIEDGVYYAWFLMDVGKVGQAKAIMDRLTNFARRYTAPSSTELSLAHARLENLKNRFYSDQNQKDKANFHIMKAIGLVLPVAERAEAPIDALSLLVTLYGNAEREDKTFREQICALAKRMHERSANDVRTIGSRVACHKRLSKEASAKGDLESARKQLQEAAGIIRNVLDLVPNDQDLLLYSTDIQVQLAELHWQPGQESERNEYYRKAGEDFVKALKHRTLFQSSTNQVKNLYQGFSKANFSEPSQELAFYNGVAEAINPTLKKFTKAPSFAFVAADANARVGALLLTDSKRKQEAEEHLSSAIDLFRRPGVMGDLSSYSEDFTAFCGAYAKRIKIRAESGRLDPMLADLKAMRAACGPAMAKYPWDFYLRQHLMGSAGTAGTYLFNLGRYKEALEYLEYSSRWGAKDSSKLLARAYREGVGVVPDESKAAELEALAAKQGTKRLTVPAYFDDVMIPIDFYLLEWPEHYPFLGIDDQLKWLKEARGGKVAPELSEAIRELHKTALENNVSFGDLCIYALGMPTDGVTIDGELWDPVAAVLMMNTGAYKTITDLFTQHPELQKQALDTGRLLLDSGVKPDMNMAKRLRKIYDDYLKEQKAKEGEKTSEGQ